MILLLLTVWFHLHIVGVCVLSRADTLRFAEYMKVVLELSLPKDQNGWRFIEQGSQISETCLYIRCMFKLYARSIHSSAFKHI